MLFDALERDLLQFFVSVLYQMRIENGFLDMCMHIQFLLDLFENGGIISVLICLHFLEQFLDNVVVGF